MNINELQEAKKEALLIYEEEKSQLINNENDDVLKDELSFIEKELNKINSLIEISQSDNIKIKEMRLEKLYMQILTDMTEEEFDNLSVDEETDIFMSLFPEKWSYMVPIDEKINYLENAIIDNNLININNDSNTIRK